MHSTNVDILFASLKFKKDSSSIYIDIRQTVQHLKYPLIILNYDHDCNLQYET